MAKKLKILPIGDWYGRIQIDIPTATIGGLKLSDGSTIQERGTVIAVSSEIKDEKVSLKVGDEILFKGHAVDIVTYDDQKYYFINGNTDGVMALIK